MFFSGVESTNLNDLLGHMKAQATPAGALSDRMAAGAFFVFTMPIGLPKVEKVAEWFKAGLTRFRKTSGGFASATIDPSSPGAVAAALSAAGVSDAEIQAGTHIYTLPSENIAPLVDLSEQHAEVTHQIDNTLSSATQASQMAAAAKQELKDATAATAGVTAAASEARVEAAAAQSAAQTARFESAEASKQRQSVLVDLEILTTKKSQLESDLADLENRISDGHKALAELQELSAQIDDLQTEKTSIEAATAEMRTSADELRQQVIADKARLSSLNDRIETASVAAVSAEAQVVNASSVAEKTLAEATSAAADIEQRALESAQAVSDQHIRPLKKWSTQQKQLPRTQLRLQNSRTTLATASEIVSAPGQASTEATEAAEARSRATKQSRS